MVRIGVVIGKAVSLKTIGGDLAKVFRGLGHTATVYDRQIPYYDALNLFDRGLVFIPFDPTYALSYILLQRDYDVHGIKSVTYTTVEGYPIRQMVKSWVKRDGKFIAVSNYVRDILEQLDIPVLDVIHHGVDLNLVGMVKPDKNLMKRLTGGRVVFGVVASSLERKGLNHLAEAIKICNDRIPEAGFYIYSEDKAGGYFAGLRNTYFDNRFGRLDRAGILRIIGGFDFYICSSLCEGFGLPVLEAQALGVPVIYPQYEPLTEFTHPQANIGFPYLEVEERWTEYGIIFQYHRYDVNEMVEAIVKAYEIYTCSQDEYLKMCSTVREHARNFDIVKLYSRFRSHLDF
ncbi:MAG: hypothetical protein QW521_05375 [Desulfurococcaceae archaeon]